MSDLHCLSLPHSLLWHFLRHCCPYTVYNCIAKLLSFLNCRLNMIRARLEEKKVYYRTWSLILTSADTVTYISRHYRGLIQTLTYRITLLCYPCRTICFIRQRKIYLQDLKMASMSAGDLGATKYCSMMVWDSDSHESSTRSQYFGRNSQQI